MTTPVHDAGPVPAADTTDRWIAGSIYGLFILGIPTAGVSLLLGALIAHLRKPDAPHWLRSHYEFQVWTLLYTAAFILISVALIATLVLAPLGMVSLVLGGLFYGLWILIRCAVGLFRLIEGREQPNSQAVFF